MNDIHYTPAAISRIPGWAFSSATALVLLGAAIAFIAQLSPLAVLLTVVGIVLFIGGVVRWVGAREQSILALRAEAAPDRLHS